jgi:hypothetical protein
MVQPPSPLPLLQSVSPPRLAPSRWPPLMGFASPLRRHLHTRVHSHPIRRSGFGHRLPHRQSRSALVVSHHLDGLLREQAVSLLHLTTGKRFAAFPPLRPPNLDARASTPGSLRGFPAAQSHPSKNSPRQQPYRVTAAVALLTLQLPARHLRRPLEAIAALHHSHRLQRAALQRDRTLIQRFAFRQVPGTSRWEMFFPTPRCSASRRSRPSAEATGSTSRGRSHRAPSSSSIAQPDPDVAGSQCTEAPCPSTDSAFCALPEHPASRISHDQPACRSAEASRHPVAPSREPFAAPGADQTTDAA